VPGRSVATCSLPSPVISSSAGPVAELVKAARQAVDLSRPAAPRAGPRGEGRCGAAAGALLGIAAATTAAGIALGFAASRGYPLALTDPAIAGYAGGTVIGAALLAAAGVGVGSMIRHQVGAIIVVVAWALVVELVVGATVTTAGRFLPYTAAAMLAGDTNGGGMPQIPRGVAALPYAAAIAVLVAIAITLSAASALATLRRDVT
jgi:ABC-2 type transport system permease protein